MGKKKSKPLLQVVREVSAELNRTTHSLNAALLKTQRVARKRGDYENVYWMLMELRLRGIHSMREASKEDGRREVDEEARRRVFRDLAPYLPLEALEAIHQRSLGPYLERRTIALPADYSTPPCVIWGTVASLESTVSIFSNLHPGDGDFSRDLGETRLVLHRIESTVRNYLRKSELALSENA